MTDQLDPYARETFEERVTAMAQAGLDATNLSDNTQYPAQFAIGYLKGAALREHDRANRQQRRADHLQAMVNALTKETA